MSKLLSIPSAGVLVILALSITWAAMIWGCGKKGPPVPPLRYRPAAVEDLSYELTDGGVLLTWTIAPAGDPKRSPVAGCIVYRSKRALTDTGCTDCSAGFKKLAEVAVPKDASGKTRPQRLVFSDPLDIGFEYAYRVTCSTEAGASGDESNLVRFEYPQPSSQQP